MQRKGVPFDQVHDIRGVRIIVEGIQECYAALGVIHTHPNWRPIASEFDDYIAVPKDNFYKSLHTAVIYEDGRQDIFSSSSLFPTKVEVASSFQHGSGILCNSFRIAIAVSINSFQDTFTSSTKLKFSLLKQPTHSIQHLSDLAPIRKLFSFLLLFSFWLLFFFCFAPSLR